jgi:D-3-phosphoglycerate dehydrogenase
VISLRPRILVAEPDGLAIAAIERLREVGELVLERCTRQRLLSIIGSFDALLVRLDHQIDHEVFVAASRLKVIATATTGLTHVDEAAAAARDVTVLSLRGETAFLKSITATAELTWGLIVALARRLREIGHHIELGNWDRNLLIGTQLAGRTIGIVGFGRLGLMVAEYASAFHMNVLAYDPHVESYPPGVSRVALDELLSRSDFITLHVESSQETHHLIGERELRLMKHTAFLINTSRGEVVDEIAVIRAIDEDRIAGVALDTLYNERGSKESWLKERQIWRCAMNRPNVIITPHVGGATHESMMHAEVFLAEKLAAFLER